MILFTIIFGFELPQYLIIWDACLTITVSFIFYISIPHVIKSQQRHKFMEITKMQSTSPDIIAPVTPGTLTITPQTVQGIITVGIPITSLPPNSTAMQLATSHSMTNDVAIDDVKLNTKSLSINTNQNANANENDKSIHIDNDPNSPFAVASMALKSGNDNGKHNNSGGGTITVTPGTPGSPSTGFEESMVKSMTDTKVIKSNLPDLANYMNWSQIVATGFGYELFINHLESEFSVESLLFITEV